MIGEGAAKVPKEARTWTRSARRTKCLRLKSVKKLILSGGRRNPDTDGRNSSAPCALEAPARVCVFFAVFPAQLYTPIKSSRRGGLVDVDSRARARTGLRRRLIPGGARTVKLEPPARARARALSGMLMRTNRSRPDVQKRKTRRLVLMWLVQAITLCTCGCYIRMKERKKKESLCFWSYYLFIIVVFVPIYNAVFSHSCFTNNSHLVKCLLEFTCAVAGHNIWPHITHIIYGKQL